MKRVRRLCCACVIAAFVAAVGASAASAQTFYVNERGGSSTCLAPGINACPTIKEAIEAARGTAGPNTIKVETESPGEAAVYKENVELGSAADSHLAIEGEEPGVFISGHVVVKSPATPVTIANLSVRESTGATAAIAETGAELMLENVFVENGSSGGKNGVEGHKGSIGIKGGTVEMENGASGFGVDATETALTIAGATVKDAGLGEAGGVGSERSGLSISGTKIIQEGGLSEANDGLIAEEDGSVTLHEVTIVQDNKDFGALLADSPASISGLSIEMRNKTDTKAALDMGETSAVKSTLQHVEIGGEWTGQALFAKEGSLTLADSRLTTNPEGTAPAMTYIGPAEGPGLLIQRSILRAGSTATRAVLQAANANVTVDSSEILGGVGGAFFESASGAARTFTLSASTLDAGVPGIINDAFETFGVEAIAKGSSSSTASVDIQGSVVLERQVAQTLSGAAATISCTYSAAPGQTQLATPAVGAIACAAGSAGNTEVNPLSALLAEPFGNYQLNPSSSAVDSVPAAAIALPFGLTPSPTDLAGNPRVVDGNGDCTAVQDKGALELQGHAAACPTPPVAKITTPPTKPIVGVLSALTISPSAFLAAPKGATISRAKKKKYGAKITYRDSQAGTTTFTVLLPSVGRRQGRSCKRPGKANRRGKRCTIYKALGSFTHTDTAGANSLHFSGRLNGKRLPKGSYRLQAVPHDAAGNGAAVSVKFTIKK